MSSCTTWAICGCESGRISVLSVAKLTCSATLPALSICAFSALAGSRPAVICSGLVSAISSPAPN
ncbi:hypothetical protein [Pseudoxanthomonas winnipegensis]|uniref:hypothetical protein n=1 Tax=Pseudoxanthomonas winnipegensis TaxID=2480810 RepID=UPI001F1DB5B3|nr:hypothetical protein [Pseudoxanthomonas winnipegensis]